MEKTEVRATQTQEVRAGKEGTVEGYGIVYETDTELFPGFFERIARGAFRRSLTAGHEIKSYVNHDSKAVLSTTRSTPALVLREDEQGVFYSSPIPPTSYGKDLEINLSRNNVTGSSFAFTVDNEDWEERSDGTIHRYITEGQVFEIGPVTDPAYVQTGAALRKTKELYELRKKESEKPETTNTTKEPEEKKRVAENILEIETLKLNLEKEIL